MAYAPKLNDIGPRLISEGYANAANTKVRGAEALASGISGAGEAVGKGLASAGKTYALKQEELDQLNGVADQMYASGNLNEEEYSTFQAASKGGKRAIVGQKNAEIEFNRKDQLDANASDRSLDRQSSITSQQQAGAAARDQMQRGMPAKPDWQKVTLEDGTIARMDMNTGQVDRTNEKARDSGGGFGSIFGAPAAAPSGGTAPDPGQRGYTPGRRYNGMTYLGGDPLNPASWQQ